MMLGGHPRQSAANPSSCTRRAPSPRAPTLAPTPLGWLASSCTRVFSKSSGLHTAAETAPAQPAATILVRIGAGPDSEWMRFRIGVSEGARAQMAKQPMRADTQGWLCRGSAFHGIAGANQADMRLQHIFSYIPVLEDFATRARAALTEAKSEGPLAGLTKHCKTQPTLDSSEPLGTVGLAYA